MVSEAKAWLERLTTRSFSVRRLVMSVLFSRELLKPHWSSEVDDSDTLSLQLDLNHSVRRFGPGLLFSEGQSWYQNQLRQHGLDLCLNYWVRKAFVPGISNLSRDRYDLSGSQLSS